MTSTGTAIRWSARIVLLVAIAGGAPALAQGHGATGGNGCYFGECGGGAPPPERVPQRVPTETFRNFPNTYVEGDGYKVWTGTSLDFCKSQCESDGSCRMFEFYWPKQKCNLYRHTRFSGQAPDAQVGIKIGQ